MQSEKVPPRVIAVDEIPRTPGDQAPTKVDIARIITRERCGSNLMLGVCWMEPGDETNLWSSRSDEDSTDVGHTYGEVDETYFIIRGKLELTWDNGKFTLGPNDCVYLAPGWRYHLKNIGNEPAFFTYSMTPAPE